MTDSRPLGRRSLVGPRSLLGPLSLLGPRSLLRPRSLLGPRRVRRRLARLARTPINFDPDVIEQATEAEGWTLTDLCQALPSESPGPPQEGGSWEVARRLMRGYEFADPSIVRAFYDPEAPLEGRNMVLKLQALNLAHLYVGVRVNRVYDELRSLPAGSAHVWGWSYQTLEGHVEMGEMHWEVWKWPDDGRVEFRVHAVSREADIRNPIVRLGFRLVRGHERQTFLDSTKRRMLTFTQLALSEEHDVSSLREAAAALTSRQNSASDPVHETLASNAERTDAP